MLFRCFAVVLGATILFANGCKSLPPVEPSTGAASATLNSVVDRTNDEVTNIKRDALEIKENTKSAMLSKSGPEIVLGKIDSEADAIVASANDIQKETAKLKKLTAEVTKLEKSLTTLRIAMEEAKAAALQRLYGYITLFWVIGFILIAAGAAVAFFLNKTYGGMLALLGALMLGFASASHRYLDEIAMVGAMLLVAGFVTAVGMIVWSTINSKRSSIAVKEIVEMMQILKETMTEDERNRIFGPDGVASKVQSDLTKEIIAKVKEKNGFKRLEEIRNVMKESEKTGATGAAPPESK